MKKSFIILLLSSAVCWAGNYPLTTCVVSGEKLGEMGDPYVFTYQGTEVKLCCDHCKAKFDKNPAKFMEKLAPKAVK